MKNYSKLLVEINMPGLKFLGKGMQSVVFELNDGQVLKVYGKDIGIKNIRLLKDFYASLNTNKVNFSTPSITDIKEVGDKLLVIERRLAGHCPNTEYLKGLNSSVLEKFFSAYLEALFSIQRIETSFLNIAEPLDLTGDFFRPQSYRNWNDLIVVNLKDKYEKTHDIFDKKVKNSAWLVDRLSVKVKSYVIEQNHLIHGDFFPANVMIDDNMNITAVLDFGILTTIGDPLFDIALGATFSDMYDQIPQLKIRKFVWSLIKQRVSEEEYIRMQIYVLIYSFISANMYKKNDPTDGHFSWCISNLNDQELLKYL